jgi:integrase
MAKRITGYYWDSKAGRYKIDKHIDGKHFRYITRWGEGEVREVEREIASLIDGMYKARLYGERIPKTFRETGIRYLVLHQDQKCIGEMEGLLRRMDCFLGNVPIHELHNEHPAILEMVAQKQKEGCKTKTINTYLEVVRRVLNAAEDWRDDITGLTWLDRAPKIKLKQIKDARPPRPLSWSSQNQLLAVLAPHQREMALFYINTGVRKREGLLLSWDWEIELPNGRHGFLLPGSITKNSRERFVPLNSVAMEVVDRQRGKHPDRVFTYEGKPLVTVNNTSFQAARKRANIDVRIHDYRHTFGHRLRVEGVDEETRAALLGHTTGNITTHYSEATLDMLFEAVDRITTHRPESPGVIVLDEHRKRLKTAEGMVKRG